MKYSLLLLIVIASCNTGNQPPVLDSSTKEKIAAQIKKEIANPESYSPVEWSEVDTLYRSMSSYPEYARMQHMEDSLELIVDSLTKDFETMSADRFKKITDQQHELRDKMLDFSKNTKREIDGWFVNHKFKVTDSKGLPEFLVYAAEFDKDMNLKNVKDQTKIEKLMEEDNIKKRE